MGQSIQLTLSSRPGIRISKAGFGRLCRDNRDLRFERAARGELEVMLPAYTDTGYRNLVLSYRLAQWIDSDRTGIGFDSSAGFTLPNGAIRSPDASWISQIRWDALSREERSGFAKIAPDFVAELRARSDKLSHLRFKLGEYIEQGSRLGWLIDLVRGRVEIYRPGREVEILENPTTLSGEDVLSGFVLDLREILNG